MVDPSWANRRLLLRGADTLSPRGRARLRATFTSDDPTDELAAAWGIKEQLRRLPACSSLTDAHQEKMRLGHYVQVDMPETDRLWATICRWWPAIDVLIVTGVTFAAGGSVRSRSSPRTSGIPPIPCRRGCFGHSAPTGSSPTG
ncbi:MAG: transposase [Rhodococcus sp. (in: high G+C Gram-positive bacteria)]|uniref:transposase n=1 Tax=Rhodococcus sp. TaxID=1831 RepID=UPI003BB10555